MSKIRVFGVVFAASAGIILAGSGLASAADTGSADSGSASLSADAKANVADEGTGSSSALVDLIKAISTGSGASK
ncbi:hypothetical protein ACIA8C_11600 [Nocardia sp. NPDC051321]|uniref:hypothetical protein n=1 Tax=Nocardia sp. NPDC051321 TaxID=3364323 RepID=UPI0037B7658E